MRLLKSQRNELFDVILAKGFDAHNFNITESGQTTVISNDNNGGMV
jgi:hypothetical protein